MTEKDSEEVGDIVQVLRAPVLAGWTYRLIIFTITENLHVNQNQSRLLIVNYG